METTYTFGARRGGQTRNLGRGQHFGWVIACTRSDIFGFALICDWYVYANCVKQKGTRGIDHPAWERFLADLDNIARGLDDRGEPLFVDSEGLHWGGIAIFGEGDLEQMCAEWGLTHYNAITQMCGWCLADRNEDNLPHTDLSRRADWRPTELMFLDNDVQCVS